MGTSVVRSCRSLASFARGRDARATGDGNDPIETRILERTRVGDGDARDERDGDGGGDERGNGSKAVDVVRAGDARGGVVDGERDDAGARRRSSVLGVASRRTIGSGFIGAAAAECRGESVRAIARMLFTAESRVFWNNSLPMSSRTCRTRTSLGRGIPGCFQLYLSRPELPLDDDDRCDVISIEMGSRVLLVLACAAAELKRCGWPKTSSEPFLELGLRRGQ